MVVTTERASFIHHSSAQFLIGTRSCPNPPTMINYITSFVSQLPILGVGVEVGVHMALPDLDDCTITELSQGLILGLFTSSQLVKVSSSDPYAYYLPLI